MSVGNRARSASEHPIVENGARVGYAASGVLHLLLAWLALRLAWGSYSGEADQSGAFQSLTGSGAGVVLLVVLGVGFVLLALWNIAEAFLVHGEAKDRVKYAAKGVTYGVLASGAFTVASGRNSSGSEQSQDLTARLMANPAGTVLVVVVGLVIVAVGGYHIYKGVAGKYREDLTQDPGRAVEMMATIGYTAKGVALIVIGGLFVAAAVTHDPEKASGMDGALRTLLELPLGKVLLTLVALGLVAYGIYSFARAKYAKV